VSQISRYLRWEFWAFCKDRSQVAATAVLLVFGLLAVWNGSRWQKREAAQLQAAATDADTAWSKSRSEAEAILGGRAKAASLFTDPTIPALAGGLGSGGAIAILPVAPLESLAVGQSDLHPRYLRAALKPEYELTENYELQNPSFLTYGHFDAAFLFVVLLPLYLLIVSRNVYAEERQSGTLMLIGAEGVDLRLLGLARLAVRFVMAFLVSVICIACACACGRTGDLGGELVTSLLLLLVISLYALFWLGIALAAHLSIRNAATSTLALLAVWVGVVIVWPGLISLTGSLLYPAPSRIEMVQSYRRASTSAARQGAKSLAGYLNDHPELAGAGGAQMSDFFATTVAMQDLTESAIRPVLSRFEEQREARERWLTIFSRVSPASTMQLAMEDAASSGDRRYQRYLNQFGKYLLQWRAYFVPRIFQKRAMDAAASAQIPRFQYVEQNSSVLAKQLLLDALYLGAFAAAVAILCAQLFTRFKPTA
jgi:ABC-2 type transport system permease protein